MKGLLVLFTVCALATAMVLKEKRAVDTDEGVEKTTAGVIICAHNTPCAWSVYGTHLKIINLNVTNTYCVCSSDKECLMNEDDTSTNTFVYRCRSPSEGDQDI